MNKFIFDLGINTVKSKKQKMSSPSWLKKFSTNFKEKKAERKAFLKL